MIGPMPGIASPARLAARPAPPPTTAPVNAPFAVALASSGAAATRGSDWYSPAALFATMLMSLSMKPAARRSFATLCASLKLSNDPTMVLIMASPWPSRRCGREARIDDRGPPDPALLRARNRWANGERAKAVLSAVMR
jgi:hypothetical protein